MLTYIRTRLASSPGSAAADSALTRQRSKAYELAQQAQGERSALPTQPTAAVSSTVTAAQSLQSWEVAWDDLLLQRVIGSGAFGTVYLAQFLSTPVAAKVLVDQGAGAGWRRGGRGGTRPCLLIAAGAGARAGAPLRRSHPRLRRPLLPPIPGRDGGAAGGPGAAQRRAGPAGGGVRPARAHAPPQHRAGAVGRRQAVGEAVPAGRRRGPSASAACMRTHCLGCHPAQPLPFLQFMGVCQLPPTVITEYCGKGSLLDVLQGAAASRPKAAQLTWTRRLNMALDAAKGMLCVGWGGSCCVGCSES